MNTAGGLHIVAARLEDLRPFVSLILGKVQTGKSPAGSLVALAKELRDLLGVRRGDGKRVLVSEFPELAIGSLNVIGFQYREARRPAWLSVTATDRDAPEDVFHQLVLICRRERYFGFHASEPLALETINRQLEIPTRDTFARLEAIDTGVLNAAFVDGDARTLWLASVHPKVATRADSKVLSGITLQDALDPLGDQGYFFTAARVSSRLLKRKAKARGTIGTTPRRSRVWAGRSKDWVEFVRSTTLILEHLKGIDVGTRRTASPLPVLASPVTTLGEVRDAFDVSLQPPELLAETAEVSSGVLEEAERWAYGAAFAIMGTEGPNLSTVLSLDGADVAQLRIELRARAAHRIELAVSPERQMTTDDDLYQEALRVCGRETWLAIRYDSGHTFAGGEIYSMRLRDVPFEGWVFRPFRGTNVRREKPSAAGSHAFEPNLIGHQDSLFCWIAKGWPECDGSTACRGWLACDDGAGEIADFVHFDPGAVPKPLICLIHVKASSSAEVGRALAVSDYELVTAQAVKNLRGLDRTTLIDALQNGMARPAAAHVWHDGTLVPNGRPQMLEAVRAAGQDLTKTIVILQPRLTETVWRDARERQARGDTGPLVARMKQLDTLLLTTQAECRALGAALQVIGAV